MCESTRVTWPTFRKNAANYWIKTDWKIPKIIASNSLDEYKIRSLIDQGAQLDSFGVGENLITSKSSPVFGGVYKLAAIEENGKLINKVKLSNTVEK